MGIWNCGYCGVGIFPERELMLVKHLRVVHHHPAPMEEMVYECPVCKQQVAKMKGRTLDYTIGYHLLYECYEYFQLVLSKCDKYEVVKMVCERLGRAENP